MRISSAYPILTCKAQSVSHGLEITTEGQEGNQDVCQSQQVHQQLMWTYKAATSPSAGGELCYCCHVFL